MVLHIKPIWRLIWSSINVLRKNNQISPALDISYSRHVMKVKTKFMAARYSDDPSWFSFGHFYVSFRKCLSGVSYTIEKYLAIRIRKFKFWNSRWAPISPQNLFRRRGYKQIAQVRTRAAWRLWYRRYLHEIDRKWGTSNSVISMLLHSCCHIVFCCHCMIKFAFKSFNIFDDVTACVYTGQSHSVNAIQSAHNSGSHCESAHVLYRIRARPPLTRCLRPLGTSPSNRQAVVSFHTHAALQPIGHIAGSRKLSTDP